MTDRDLASLRGDSPLTAKSMGMDRALARLEQDRDLAAWRLKEDRDLADWRLAEDRDLVAPAAWTHEKDRDLAAWSAAINHESGHLSVETDRDLALARGDGQAELSARDLFPGTKFEGKAERATKDRDLAPARGAMDRLN